MNYRKLGRTDIEVSVICFGCWPLAGGPTWGEQSEDDSFAAIHAALDAGINFFDTAEGYGRGRSEEILGRGLGSRRKDVIIASKVSGGNLEPQTLKEHCENSLKNLGTDTIDLYQIHWPRRHMVLADTFGAMQELKAAGKIRAIGVSNFGRSYLTELLELGHVESNQVAYSLLWRAIEYEVQSVCAENDVGILCYSPLYQALLTGKYTTADDVPVGRVTTRIFSEDRPSIGHGEAGCEEAAFGAIAEIRKIAESIGQPMGNVALAWLLAQKGVTSAIAGGRNAEQAAQNAAAAELQLDAETLSKLSSATENVKNCIGKNADMWESESRMER